MKRTGTGRHKPRHSRRDADETILVARIIDANPVNAEDVVSADEVLSMAWHGDRGAFLKIVGQSINVLEILWNDSTREWSPWGNAGYRFLTEGLRRMGGPDDFLRPDIAFRFEVNNRPRSRWVEHNVRMLLTWERALRDAGRKNPASDIASYLSDKGWLGSPGEDQIRRVLRRKSRAPQT